MTKAEQARENFLNGGACAQSVLLAFREECNAPEEVLRHISLPFGGGMGRLRQTCGCVSGAVMALGLLFPDLSKSDLYALVQSFASRFREENGSCNCGELLRGAGLKADVLPNAEARTEEYYKKRPCPELVYSAARILEELCREQGRL